MLNQQWLTVGASTLVAGTIASISLPSKPIAVMAASTAGAVVGAFLTNPQKSYSSKSGKVVSSNEVFVHSTSELESSLARDNVNLTTLKEQISRIADQHEKTTLKVEETVTRLEKLLEQNSSELSELKEKFSELNNEDRTRKTAIFYDIENLLKGYSLPKEVLESFSLKEIFNVIQGTGKVGQIAVQQAYANWSDYRLGKKMRREINELGINPIQVFGFAYEPKKNAADIQLVIDAVNLANVRSSIDTFVIVSGDGGFAALAKQLHEYGKTVIGFAYQGSASKTLQAVCDDFVWIKDPTSASKQFEESESQNTHPNSSVKRTVSSSNNQESEQQFPGLDPRNARLISQIERRIPTSIEDSVALTQEVLNWYSSDPACRLELSRSGIYLSVVQQAVSYVIPGLQTIQLGFPKFSEYIQYACKGSELCIAHVPPSRAVLTLRNSMPKQAQMLPDLEPREVHSVETYRLILATGAPIYRLPALEELYTIGTWVVEHPIDPADLGTLVEIIVTGLNEEISSEVVKLTLMSFLSAGILIRDSEQKVSLRSDITSLAIALPLLKSGVTQKLTAILPSALNEAVLQQILPDAG